MTPQEEIVNMLQTLGPLKGVELVSKLAFLRVLPEDFPSVINTMVHNGQVIEVEYEDKSYDPVRVKSIFFHPDFAPRIVTPVVV